MSIWSTILLLLISLISLIFWIKQARNFQDLVFQLNGSLIFILILFLFSTEIFWPETQFSELAIKWLQIILTSLTLTFLANMLRKLKPSYAKYPILFSFLPLLLIVVFPLIRESDVIYTLLFRLVLGGGSLSFLIMSVMLWKKDSKMWSLCIGSILLLIAYLLEWFFTNISSYHPWTVHVSIAGSIPLIMYSFRQIEQHINH